ncbi:hypothetical protein SAMN02745157_1546 [Kaistia soli DSM 19436]|uniref:Uncharacterized protein n=2 Tax=Kaistia TaxID=166953 RepID=A0A1M4YK72_9HYPH|nr:hypothetical protein SAMN02745157_1546 [Kaistia soli DSM 19436]
MGFVLSGADAPTKPSPFGKLLDDPLMSEGTLALWDPRHHLCAFTGVPIQSQVIGNAAKNQAAIVLGLDASLLDFTASVTVTGTTEIKIERSGKGGLHTILSQVNETVSNNKCVFNGPSALRDYLFNLVPSGAVGICIWQRVTRSAIAAGPSASTTHLVSSSSGNVFLWAAPGGSLNGASPLGTFSANSAEGARFNTIGINAWSGTKPGSSNSTGLQIGGSPGGVTGNANNNKKSSNILYRVQIEDLTKSKRSNSGFGGTVTEEYNAFQAAMYAQFQKEFAAGGAFYGDTFTDPATFP